MKTASFYDLPFQQGMRLYLHTSAADSSKFHQVTDPVDCSCTSDNRSHQSHLEPTEHSASLPLGPSHDRYTGRLTPLKVDSTGN